MEPHSPSHQPQFAIASQCTSPTCGIDSSVFLVPPWDPILESVVIYTEQVFTHTVGYEFAGLLGNLCPGMPRVNRRFIASTLRPGQVLSALECVAAAVVRHLVPSLVTVSHQEWQSSGQSLLLRCGVSASEPARPAAGHLVSLASLQVLGGLLHSDRWRWGDLPPTPLCVPRPVNLVIGACLEP